MLRLFQPRLRYAPVTHNTWLARHSAWLAIIHGLRGSFVRPLSEVLYCRVYPLNLIHILLVYTIL